MDNFKNRSKMLRFYFFMIRKYNLLWKIPSLYAKNRPSFEGRFVFSLTVR